MSRQKTMGEMAASVHRREAIFYDSAKAPRSLCGRWHYCISCPGWVKATNERVIYSRWEQTMLPFDGCCCGLQVPCGRQLDSFDAEIIVDAVAHQSLCQLCRGEGDIILYRLEGGDVSDSRGHYTMPDVADPFSVFTELTFDLAKLNLAGLTRKGLGRRMGAVTWDHSVAGADGAPTRSVDPNRERIYYDSTSARRTWLGALCNADCCCEPVYKITSERVLHTRWHYWHPCA
jgi:hypothetical protein